jgi:hypothetical protein
MDKKVIKIFGLQGSLDLLFTDLAQLITILMELG